MGGTPSKETCTDLYPAKRCAECPPNKPCPKCEQCPPPPPKMDHSDGMWSFDGGREPMRLERVNERYLVGTSQEGEKSQRILFYITHFEPNGGFTAVHKRRTLNLTLTLKYSGVTDKLFLEVRGTNTNKTTGEIYEFGDTKEMKRHEEGKKEEAFFLMGNVGAGLGISKHELILLLFFVLLYLVYQRSLG